MEPIIMDHPLIQYKITLLRSKTTGTKEFRELVNEISMLMCYEATRDLPLTEVDIETPICRTKGKIIDKKVVFIPILRAGLGMENGMLEMIPAGKVGHIGVFRDPETLEPVEYYGKFPKGIENAEVILLDPMLATGGSAVFGASVLKKNGAKNIRFMCMVASPEGMENFCTKHPDIPVYCGAMDEGLNEHGYIVPGLGDAGDRIFGTK